MSVHRKPAACTLSRSRAHNGGAGRPPLTPPFRSLQQQNNLPDSSGNRRPQETNPQETPGSPTTPGETPKIPGASGGENGVPFLEEFNQRPGNFGPGGRDFSGRIHRQPLAAGGRAGTSRAEKLLGNPYSVSAISGNSWIFRKFPEISENFRKFPGISETARKWGSPGHVGPAPHASETDPTCPYTSFWRQRFRI